MKNLFIGITKIMIVVLALQASGSLVAVSKSEELLNAAGEGNYTKVQTLLNEGVNPNVKATDSGDLGWTALHYASAFAHPEIVALLVLNGANTAIRDTQGFTPRDIARQEMRKRPHDTSTYKMIIDMLKPRDRRTIPAA